MAEPPAWPRATANHSTTRGNKYKLQKNESSIASINEQVATVNCMVASGRIASVPCWTVENIDCVQVWESGHAKYDALKVSHSRAWGIQAPRVHTPNDKSICSCVSAQLTLVTN